MTASEAPTHVFISYAWKDGAELARRLYDELKTRSFDPWKDDDRMRGGATWTKEVATALDATEVVVALVSPGSNDSEVCGWERVRALRKNKYVIPVIAVPYTDVPLEFEGKIYRDLSGAKPYANELKALLEDIGLRQNGVSLPERLRTTYVTAPPLPFNYVEREDVVFELRQALSVDEVNEARPSIAMTALQGMGGIGKTVIAQSLAHDEVVQQAFPDGVLWVTVGKEPANNLVTRLREIGNAFREDLAADISDLGATTWYRNAIREKAALVILDDVWHARDIDPFRAKSPRSRLLLTTRDEAIASSTGARLIRAGSLTSVQSRELLARRSGLRVNDLPADAEALVRECGGLVLALATIGAMLRGKGANFWPLVLELMYTADLAKLRQQFPDYPYPDILRALQVSVDTLDVKTRKRYMALAVMLEDMPIHPLIQRVLWDAGDFDSLETAEELIRLALAQRIGSDGCIRLHDLLLDYVRAQYSDREALGLIHGAMRLSSHIIERDPSQFTSQIVGRLLPHVSAAVRQFAKALVDATPRPFLRPLKPALQPPGTGLLRVLEGHAGWVNAVAITRDGRRVVSASHDETVKVWDLESGRELLTLQGHAGSISAVAVTPDGKRVVSASHDKTLKVWELESGVELRAFQGHAGRVRAVTLTPDGTHVVSASADGTLKVWHLESGREASTLRSHAGSVNDVAVTSDGHCAVSASRDTTLKVWELESGRELRTLRGHADSVNALALTPDGQRVVSASSDKTLRIWELNSGRELWTIGSHTDKIRAVAVTPDGRRAVSASSDGTLKIWDLESGHQLRTLQGHASRVRAVSLTPDGRRAISASVDKTLMVWELESTSEPQRVEGHSGSTSAMAVTPDNRHAVSASHDRTLKVWNLVSGHELLTLEGHDRWVSAVAVTSDGRCAVSASADCTLKVWELKSGSELRTIAGHSAWVRCVAVTPDGRRAVSGSDDSTLKIWELETLSEIRTLRGHTGVVKAVTVTQDGRNALSASHDSTLNVWDLDSGRVIQTFRGHTAAVNAVALTPDGRQAISASADKTLKIWELERGRGLRTLEGHSSWVLSVSVTPDGRHAISASADKTIRAWELKSGTTIAKFYCDASAQCCAVTDDFIIAAGDHGGRVYVLTLEMMTNSS